MLGVTTIVFVCVGVNDGVSGYGVSVPVAVKVTVTTGVLVRVPAGVLPGVTTAVFVIVAVPVKVTVGGTAEFVGVAVAVNVALTTGVPEELAVAEYSAVAVAEDEGTGEFVAVAVRVNVAVGGTGVFVAVAVLVKVAVGGTGVLVVVAVRVAVGNTELVEVLVAVLVNVGVFAAVVRNLTSSICMSSAPFELLAHCTAVTAFCVNGCVWPHLVAMAEKSMVTFVHAAGAVNTAP